MYLSEIVTNVYINYVDKLVDYLTFRIIQSRYFGKSFLLNHRFSGVLSGTEHKL